MSNDLSKQLCELCGVEPKKIKKCKAGQGCADFPGCEGRFGDKTCYIEQTVDFTKPENFIRLYELINKQNRAEVLQRLVQRIRVESGSHIDELKQSIREAEWVYE